MFPTPIAKSSRTWQLTYQTLLPLALVFWLAPLIAVAVFSVKPGIDFTQGNYWGLPSTFEGVTNYGKVFFESDMPRYLLNSVFITVPTVIGAVALSCMAGFALGIYRFKGNLLIFFMFVAGNFVPFQILMVPVRDLTLDLGLYNTKTGLVLFHIAFQAGFCTLFMRNFIKALPYELIESTTDRSKPRPPEQLAVNPNGWVPVLLWDERWSTTSAERDMIGQDFSRRKRAERIDSHAAAVFLQGAIDALAGGVL